MSTTVLTSPTRPKVFVAGAPALGPGIERYVLKGGGTAAFELDAGDRIEIASLEGGQAVEIAAFGKGGKSDLAAFGLTSRKLATGIQRALEADSEDAARVRFGLFRRGLDLGRARAAQVLAPDAAAGEMATLEAQHGVFVVLGAPAEPMIVWEQSPPSDVLVFIRRANQKPRNAAPLPDPIAEPRLDIRVNVASAESFEVYEGEYIQIIDVQGRQCSDFIAFNRKALDEGREQGLDALTTRTLNGASYPRPGLSHSKFFDRDRNPLVEIVQDTVGRHDTFNLACTTRYYEDMGYFGHPNCTDNFNNALKAYDPISQLAGWPAINFFYNTNVDGHNTIWSDEPWSRPGDYVVMRALTDLVCGASSCPLRHRRIERLAPDRNSSARLPQGRPLQALDRIPHDCRSSSSVDARKRLPSAHLQAHAQLRRVPRLLGAALLRQRRCHRGILGLSRARGDHGPVPAAQDGGARPRCRAVPAGHRHARRAQALGRAGVLYDHVLRARRHGRRRHAVPPRRQQFPLDRWRRREPCCGSRSRRRSRA